MRIPGWTKLNAQQLWETWRACYDSEAEAIATAVWCANRLVKGAKLSTRRRFYELKDLFIRRYGQNGVGQRVRHEINECWHCEDGCERCNWTGIYKERWLYVHYFTVAGKSYCFHSYQEPAQLIVGMGRDASQYGGQFTEEEIAELPLPLSGLVRMLRYVAAVKWCEETAVSHAMSIRYFWVGSPQGQRIGGVQ